MAGPGDIVCMPMPLGSAASDFIDLHAGPEPFPEKAPPSAEEIERIRLKWLELAQKQPEREARDNEGIESEARLIVRRALERRKSREDEMRNKERIARMREAKKRILDFDPKQGGVYYTRFRFKDLTNFDLDAESSRGPMRFTDKVYTGKSDGLCEAVNIFTVKIASSDVGFPIHVYGTVLARDSPEYKCVYLFRRDRDHCQLINSEDESLILTGPKRALELVSAMHVETNLMIRGSSRTGGQRTQQRSHGDQGHRTSMFEEVRA